MKGRFFFLNSKEWLADSAYLQTPKLSKDKKVEEHLNLK